MLNKNNERELCYVVKITGICPIEGADRVEIAQVGGWQIMVRKDAFKVGDKAIYFEIDSRVPEVEPFLFLEKTNYKIKTQKYFKGTVLSQGLLMEFDDFGFNSEDFNEGDFLTERLGVTYAAAEDNQRKKDNSDKYRSMTDRHKKLFKNPIIRKIMRYEVGRKILFFFFGKKRDDKSYPTQFSFVHKTDEERIENIPAMLKNKTPLIATEKLDGTSSTFIVARKGKVKHEFYVLSRNVRQLSPDQECYYSTNVYWEMALKYNIEKNLLHYMNKNNLEYVCLQGETVGPNVQGNPLKLPELDFYAFNLIRSDTGRVSSLDGSVTMDWYGIKWVPFVDMNWVNPDTMEEMKALTTGNSMVNPSVMREGLVYRCADNNTISFKNVSNEFLLSKKE